MSYLDMNADDDLGDENVPRLRFSVAAVVFDVLALAMPDLTFGLLNDDFLALVSNFCFSLLREEDSVVGIWIKDETTERVKSILTLSRKDCVVTLSTNKTPIRNWKNSQFDI